MGVITHRSSLFTLAHALCLWSRFNPGAAELQFVEKHAWIPSLGVDYFLGADGLSLLMILLTALVVPGAILAALLIVAAPNFLGSRR